MFGSTGTGSSASSFTFPPSQTASAAGTTGSGGNSGFSFGRTSSLSSAPSSSFSLGPPAQSIQRQNSVSGPMFGGGSNNPTTTSAPLFGGGSNQTTSSAPLFGGGSNQTTSSAPLFGGGSNQTTSSAPLFGGNTTNQTTNSAPLFGGGSTNQTTSSAPLFGGLKTTTNSQFGGGANLFGSNTNQSKPLFGGTTSSVSQPTTGGLFGGNTNNPPTTGGMFGASNQTTSGVMFAGNNSSQSASGLFGGNTSASKPTTAGGYFGAGGAGLSQQSTTTSGGGPFGTSIPTSNSSPSLFGNNTPSQSMFGSTTNPLQYNSLQTPSLYASINQASFSLAGTPSASPAGSTLGPLTTPRANFDSATSTPGSFRNSFNRRQNSLKSSPSARLLLSGARSSPYASNNSPYGATRRDGGNTNGFGGSSGGVLSRSRSEFHLGASRRQPIATLRSERSIDDFSSIPKALQDSGRISEVKRLIINKGNKSLESITGKKKSVDLLPEPTNVTNGGDPKNRRLNLNDSRSNDNINGNGRPQPQNVQPQSPTQSDRGSSNEPFLTPSFGRTQRDKQNNLKTKKSRFEINQTAADLGYWIVPPLATLYGYSREQLRKVENLSIGRRGYGQINYEQPVDLSGIDNLSDILGNIVVFGPVTVCVYPDESKKPEQGQELNVPATVVLEKTFAMDRKTNQPIKDPEDPRLIRHKLRLRRSIEARGGEFLTYDIDNGLWVFKVPHFSVWGLIDSDDEMNEIDEYLHDPDFDPAFGLGENTMNNVLDNAIHDALNNDDNNNIYNVNDINPNGNDTLEKLGLNETSDQMDATTSQPGEDIFLRKAAPKSWGIPDASFQYDSLEDDQIENRHFLNDSPLRQKKSSRHINGNGITPDNDALNNEVLEQQHNGEQLHGPAEFQLVPVGEAPSENEYVFSPRTWVEQLHFSSRIDSPLAFTTSRKDHAANIEGREKQIQQFTSSDIDQLLYGGISSLSSSSASQYEKAATELRLPSLFSKTSFARFNASSTKLLIKSSSGIIELRNIPGQDTVTNVLLTHQISLTKIEKRSNGLPLSTPRSNFTMKFLATHCNPSSSEERNLWELASILFDDVSLTGLESISSDEFAPHVIERIKEQHRRGLLSNWLKKCVAKDVATDDSSSKNALDSVLVKLTGNLLQESAFAAAKSNNFHLATIIPLLGTDDNGIRQDARSQIEDWKRNKAIFHIPHQVRKVFELLSGNTTVAEEVRVGGEVAPALYLSEGLDWKRAFGLRLWYESNRRVSIPEVVESYRRASEVPTNRVARPLVISSTSSTRKVDITFQLLSLYGSMSPDLSSVLEPVGESSFNFREPWYIYIVLVFSSGLFSDIGYKLGDKLSTNFGCQLEDVNKWVEALFVFSHIRDDRAARVHIERVLSHHVDDFINDASIRRRLVHDLGIPEKSIYEAISLKARYSHDYFNEATNLIQAELWEEAHRTIISKVAPRAVIENRPEKIADLLRKIPHPYSIFSWEVGGQMYLDYADLVESLRSGGITSGGDDQLVNRLATKLSRALAEVKIGRNSEIKVAVSLMSSFVGKYASKVSS